MKRELYSLQSLGPAILRFIVHCDTQSIADETETIRMILWKRLAGTLKDDHLKDNNLF